MIHIRNFFNRIANGLTHAFINVQTRPTSADALNIKPDHPVIYVLDDRAWSSLSVLELGCIRLQLPSSQAPIELPYLHHWRSLYRLAPPRLHKIRLTEQLDHPAMLLDIVKRLRSHPDDVIQFVPVTIFRGKPVSQKDGALSLLFADSWSKVHRRKFLTLLFHGRNAIVDFSNAVSIRAADFRDLTDLEFVDALQHRLTEPLREMRVAALGPDLSHRRSLLHKLLRQPGIQTAIQTRSREAGISEHQASLQARNYLLEILADCSTITVLLARRALITFWKHFYSGIEVSNDENLAALAHSHELVYVPCHRSHIDYLLMSYVINEKGLPLPFIAAGNNLNMPIIGSILRRGGAFFIRRSFRGNEIYSALIFEYLSILLDSGMPVEYFIEGTRSRNGRLLKPRPGLLSMTVRSYLRERNKPIAFIPVSIAYEKLMESKAYQAELAGKGKKAESVFSSLASIFRIRGNFGKVYTSFGEPVILDRLLDSYYPNWNSEAYDDNARPQWLRPCVNHLGQTLLRHINCAATVNPTQLVATALLATPRLHIDEATLITALERYTKLIRLPNYSNHIVISELDGAEQIQCTEQLRLISRRHHELGDIIYLDEKQSTAMTYYRNNILHLMAMPALIACCFLNMRTHTREEIISIIAIAYPFIRAELYLIWEEHELADVISRILDAMAQQNLLIRNEQLDVYSRPTSSSADSMHLTMLAKIISPMLEVYYLTTLVLLRDGQKKTTRTDLENSCYLMSQRIALVYELNLPDFSDRSLIANFIDTLIRSDYISGIDNERLEYRQAFQHADRRVRLLLSRDMRNNIMQAIKLEC